MENQPDAAAEIAELLREFPPMGEWVDSAACGALGLVASEAFVADHPDIEEKRLAERICRRCPVRAECAAYATETPIFGMWAGHWYTLRSGQHRAA